MLTKGQIIEMNHSAKQFEVVEVSADVVKIQFASGHPYEICRNGDIFDCDFRGKGIRQLLSQSNIRRGYKQVNVHANGQSVAMKVHRLVAMCFLPNPQNLPVINHKDENPSNNHVDNLEWCTQKYNTNYSRLNHKMSKKYMNAKLTKDKVKAMLPKDCIFIPCDNAAEVESAYQTAIQAKQELGDNGNKIAVSKSQKTLSVVVRTGIN